MDDDLWEDEVDELEYEVKMRERDLNRLRGIHSTQGYKEGISEGQENEQYLQQGFNLGFKQCSEVVFGFGYITGVLEQLSVHLSALPETEETTNLIQEMDYFRATIEKPPGLNTDVSLIDLEKARTTSKALLQRAISLVPALSGWQDQELTSSRNRG